MACPALEAFLAASFATPTGDGAHRLAVRPKLTVPALRLSLSRPQVEAAWPGIRPASSWGEKVWCLSSLPQSHWL